MPCWPKATLPHIIGRVSRVYYTRRGWQEVMVFIYLVDSVFPVHTRICETIELSQNIYHCAYLSEECFTRALSALV